MGKIRKSLTATMIVLLLAVGSVAQESISLNNPDTLIPTNCEMNSVKLDNALDRFIKKQSEGSTLILIARFGNGEYSRELNRRRLFNVKQYLVGIRGIDLKKIIVAESGRVKGYGRVEVYVGGVLFEILVARRQKDLCLTCCGPDEQFYPDRKDRRRNK